MNLAVSHEPEPAKTCCSGSSWALFAASIVSGIVLARGAVWIETAGFSPLFIFRVLVGGLIGFAVLPITTQLGLRASRATLAAAICAAVTFVIFEHVFFYVDYRSNLAAAVERNPAAAVFQATGEVKPAGFFEFLSAGAAHNTGPISGWARWIIDAILTIVAAASVAWFTSRPRALSPRAHEIPS